MDSMTIRHLRESVALLPMEDFVPAREFYGRLFELAPEVRPLFERDIGLQAKKFSDMFAWVIENLEHPDELCKEMRALGARHRGYGVTIDHYAPLGSALIWMFQYTLGDRFTPEMEEAWLEAYAFLSLEAERGSREAGLSVINPYPSTRIDHAATTLSLTIVVWRSSPRFCHLLGIEGFTRAIPGDGSPSGCRCVALAALLKSSCLKYLPRVRTVSTPSIFNCHREAAVKAP